MERQQSLHHFRSRVNASPARTFKAFREKFNSCRNNNHPQPLIRSHYSEGKSTDLGHQNQPWGGREVTLHGHGSGLTAFVYIPQHLGSSIPSAIHYFLGSFHTGYRHKFGIYTQITLSKLQELLFTSGHFILYILYTFELAQ